MNPFGKLELVQYKAALVQVLYKTHQEEAFLWS